MLCTQATSDARPPRRRRRPTAARRLGRRASSGAMGRPGRLYHALGSPPRGMANESESDGRPAPPRASPLASCCRPAAVMMHVHPVPHPQGDYRQQQLRHHQRAANHRAT